MKSARAIVLLTTFLVMSLLQGKALTQPTCEDENWDSRFLRPGQISPIRVAAANGKVYVAGTYSEPYDQGIGIRNVRQVTGIFTWDGQKWSYPSYDNGLNAGGSSWTFYDIMVFGTDVIVSGSFTQTNGGDMTIKYIARWDGTQWWPLGDGVNGVVHALTTTGNFDVYAGGQFTRIGTDTANYVARWTSGGGWEPLLDPGGTQQGTNNTVQSLTVYNNRIILGGAFTSVASGIPANHLAEWNWTTQNWAEFEGGTNGVVSKLASGIGGLYVADVSMAGITPITGVALWDGGSWNDLATPSFSGINDMAVHNSSDLVACGSYLDSPPGQINRTFAKYNSVTSQWEELLPSCNLGAASTDLAVDGTDIYAVVGFTFGGLYACNSNLDGVAKFNGVEWRGMGDGMTTNGSWGTALYVSDTAAYVGGILGHLGGVGMHNGIGRWSFADERWNNFEMGGISGLKQSGFDATVWDVHEIEGNVYVVGQFTNAGSIATKSIVGWDGASFFPLGGGTDVSSVVYAVEPFKGDIYIGGFIFNMTQPDNSTPSLGGFVRWNGAIYERPAGSALNSVYELEDAGDYIYIGGQFVAGAQTPTSNIVRYDGSVFDSVGGGVNGRVLDIEVAGADVYVAGGFQTVKNPDGSQIDAKRLARWNGVTWESMGDFNDTVRAVFVRGGEVYAAGHFTMVDGIEARHIAYHDGNSWNAIGEGTDGEITINNGEIYELDSDGDNLWMTGRFSHAGGVPSQNIARWKFCTPKPPSFDQGGTGSDVNGTSVTLTWDSPGGSTFSTAVTTYDIQVAEGNNFSTIIENASGINGTSHVVNGLQELSDYSWRVRAQVDAEMGAWSERMVFTAGFVTAIGDDGQLLIPRSFALEQNYPNPFNPRTSIRFELPKRTHVQIEIINMLGQRVRKLLDENRSAGIHKIEWDGNSSDGNPVSSGIYFYRIVAEDFINTKKMIMLK